MFRISHPLDLIRHPIHKKQPVPTRKWLVLNGTNYLPTAENHLAGQIDQVFLVITLLSCSAALKLGRDNDPLDGVTDKLARVTDKDDVITDKLGRVTDKDDDATDKLARATDKDDGIRDKLDGVTDKDNDVTDKLDSVRDKLGCIKRDSWRPKRAKNP